MRKLAIVIVTLLCIVSCANLEKNIQGNWYFLENDFTYNEVFISDSSFFYFSEVSGFYGPLKYEVKGDMLIFYAFDKSDNKYYRMDYSPQMKYLNTDEFSLSYKEQFRLLKRLSLNILSLEKAIKNDSLSVDYYKQFHYRRIKYLYENGFIADTLFTESEVEILEPLDGGDIHSLAE